MCLGYLGKYTQKIGSKDVLWGGEVVHRALLFDGDNMQMLSIQIINTIFK